MITREEILDLAILAKLFVSEEELDVLTEEMSEIISFADTINNAGMEAEFDGINRLSNVFREDVPAPSYPQEEILRNAGGGEDGFFHVRRRG